MTLELSAVITEEMQTLKLSGTTISEGNMPCIWDCGKDHM